MKIQNKLFLVLFSYSLLLVTALVLIMQWSIGRGMIEYVNTKQIEALKPLVLKLSKEYSASNSWMSMDGNHQKFYNLIVRQLEQSQFDVVTVREARRPPRPRPSEGPPQRMDARPPPHLQNMPPPHEANHYALLNADGDFIVGKYLQDIQYSNTPIMLNDSIIGYLAISKLNSLTQGYEFDFINKQHIFLWLIALLALVFVALITFPLTHHLVKPIKQITKGMHRLTQGQYKNQINLNRKDELGELSRDYNELARTLSNNDIARKRWLANISHELRTPVAILRGELEAILDNIRPLTKSNIESANDEVQHLQRLIDDLHQLTSADIGGMKYNKEHYILTTLLQDEIDKYRSYLSQSSIELTLQLTSKTIAVYADKTRLYQLFENILNNAIKYSKASKLNISLQQASNQALITFEDNGVGVAEQHLDNLFEYLYRVDESRNRKDGGSGLGLSICKRIVEDHDGRIIANKSPLGGLAIMIVLPIS